MVDPETQLDHVERGQLVQLILSPGWNILLHKIMEPECEKFKVALINVKAGDTSALIESHAIAKSAAQFLVGIVGRLNNEYAVYLNSNKNEGTKQNPIDIEKEMMLDLGNETEEIV